MNAAKEGSFQAPIKQDDPFVLQESYTSVLHFYTGIKMKTRLCPLMPRCWFLYFHTVIHIISDDVS